MKHTWLPAHSKGRPVILRWKQGLEQLFVCRESQQAKWQKVPKEGTEK